MARGDTAATSALVAIRFNNDSAANYDYQVLGSQDVAGVFSENNATTFIHGGDMTASTGDANAAGQSVGDIANYAGTTFHKTCVSTYYTLKTTTQSIGGVVGGRWRSTSAINRITVFLGAGSMIAGSRFTLYGLA